MRFHAAFALIGALCSGAAFAHSGSLDKNGCHHDGKTGGYHCHRGSSGFVRVIDGDSLKMGTVEIRLHGVDAVEFDQMCRRQNGERWRCGRSAARALGKFIGNRTVTCLHHGEDAYGRTLATCSIPSGEINDWLVRQGWALAYRRYSSAYIEAEEEAKADRRNIWSTQFTDPETYRHNKRN